MPHHEHEWNNGNKTSGSGIAATRRQLPRNWTASRIHPSYWCPGRKVVEEESSDDQS